MGCSCLLRKNENEDVNNEIKNDQNDISNMIDIENNNKIANNNDNINGNNDNANNIIVSNQLNSIPGKNLLGLTQLQLANKRAKSTPINPEEEDKKEIYVESSQENHEYRQIESDLITSQELEEFLSAYKPLEDSIEVEIRPTTICENKTVYYGEWDIKNNKRHGRGIQVWPDGSKYMGYWQNNQACGKGKLIHQDGDIYEGDWQSDKPNGEGCYIHIDGTKYVGEWKNDKQDGKGEEKWPDGSTYIGE